jgi:8-oxo-dGTP pyrophosphatase MutT (NUDIX family)
MRGMWETHDDVKYQLIGMTLEEKRRLVSHSFDELWVDLWITHDIDLDKHLPRFRKKFESVLPYLPELIESTKNSVSCSLSWGFPKGKTNVGESAKECAVREFKEEANVFRSKKAFDFVDYNIDVWNIGPLSELYVGGDGRTYITYYYLATCSNEFFLKRFLSKNSIRGTTLSEEATDAQWVSVEDAPMYLSSTHLSLLTKAKDIFRI